MSTQQTVDLHKLTRGGWADDEAVARYARAEKLTGLFAQTLIDKSGIVSAKDDVSAFDLATGTGIVVAKLYENLSKEQKAKLKVLGGDVSEPMLKFLKKRAEHVDWPGFETKVVDGNNIQLPQDTFTHIFVNFGIFVMKPGTSSVLRGLLKPGGFLGFTTWKKLAWYPWLVKAVERAPSKPYCPTEAEVEHALYSGLPWQATSYIESILQDAGFKNVETQEQTMTVDVGTPKENTEVMQLPLMMLSAFWEEGKRSALIKEVLGAFEENLTEQFGADGNVTWEWTAIIATGWKAE
ncbi:S-adenosyl-L-methionine-dependent methyltransferase [Lophiotrema nucula]|uniref:S-adenosyl-L-methionine-dependent methyltransferase n=1 Tax=Lophiotrema nucula TaxID=690887 RepID=A0A6A5ZJU0_9PLEO|nr:S-adenosyl-L-methionine-dependent methyltransferase [Lophiotrema nucula]